MQEYKGAQITASSSINATTHLIKLNWVCLAEFAWGAGACRRHPETATTKEGSAARHSPWLANLHPPRGGAKPRSGLVA